jgi:hypothetical protein
MRKLSFMVAALFLLASAPAFAQTAGSEENKAETKSETSASPSGSKETTTTTKKTTKKKHSKKHKMDKMGADAGM